MTPNPDSPTSGIQEAIDALPPGGGVIELGAGHFPVSRGIVLESGVVLAGAGASTRIVLGDGAGRPGEETHVINCRAGATGLQIRDLSVDGNYAGQSWTSTDLGGGGISLDGAQDVLIENVRVRNTWRHGIWLYNSRSARIVGCEVVTTGTSGISLGGQHHFRTFTEDVLISGCRLSGSRKSIGRMAGNCGVEIKDHTRRVIVDSCTAFDHPDGYGFAVLVHRGRHPEQDVREIVFQGCTARECHKGFVIGSNGDFPVDEVTVAGCTGTRNATHGLYFHAHNGGKSVSLSVVGGSFFDNGGPGIEVGGDADGAGLAGVAVSANRVYRNRGGGIRIGEATSNVVCSGNAEWDNDE